MLVLLHGLGADEYDLLGLADELDPRLFVASLRAPFETGFGGYAWFGIEFSADGSRSYDEEQAAESCASIVEALLELPRELGVTPSKLVLGGFSQGAMMSAGVVMQRPDLVDAAWLMSGRYLPRLDTPESTARVVPILQQHGRFDELIAVAEGRELAEILSSKGHTVDWHEYDMGHQVSLESLRDADEWMSRVLA